MSNIPEWNDLGNEPMTKREQIAALMMHAHMSRGHTHPFDGAERAVVSADALIAELKRRKEPATMSRPPLTEEQMQREIEQTEQSLSTRYMQLILANQHLRADVRYLIEKALVFHKLSTPQ